MPTETLLRFALPAALFTLGVLLGLFLEKVILRWLNLLAERTSWRADNVIFRSIRGVPIFWGVALGIYLVTLTTEVAPALLEVLQQVLLVAVLWSVTIIVARVAAGLTATYASREGTFLPMTSLIPGLIRLLVYVVGALIILSELKLSIAPLLTALGVGGLAVALALQDTLANVFAGLYLIAAREVNPGDFVVLDTGAEGYVQDINWRSTTLKTVLDNMIIVPNAHLAGAVVTNHHLGETGLRIRVPVPVPYEADLDRVERLLEEEAQATLRELFPSTELPPVQLYLHTFGEFSLNMTVLLPAPEYMAQYRLRHRFMQRVLARFSAEGIKIPFPIREFEMGIDPEAFGERLQAPSKEEAPAAEGMPREGEPGRPHGLT